MYNIIDLIRNVVDFPTWEVLIGPFEANACWVLDEIQSSK